MRTENVDDGDMAIPWPKTADILFKEGDDWWNNACVTQLRLSWNIYAIGYKDAADVLCAHVCETRRHADFLIYPIAFNYRHYLELRLKDIIVLGQALLDQPPDLQHVHKIDVLWRVCRKILEEVEPGSARDDLQAVEDCIDQFSKVDPDSMGFRYPTDRKGQETLSNLPHINIRNLQEVMDRISSLLEGAHTAISTYLDHKYSMGNPF